MTVSRAIPRLLRCAVAGSARSSLPRQLPVSSLAAPSASRRYTTRDEAWRHHEADSPKEDTRDTADPLAEGGAKGRTGGGKPLSSSSPNAPPQPKIGNFSVKGSEATENMTEEQKREVDKHNKEFEKKHDRGTRADDDKVDKDFWSRGG